MDFSVSSYKNVIRVLHVDDDPSIQEITKLMLLDLNSGFEIDWACCVDEAFKKLASGHYDVVVSDYEMPQKDGLQFLKEFREKKKDMPFILFTGKGREEVTIKALNLGADGYYNKQGSPETVYGELAHGIRRSFEHIKAGELLKKSQAELNAIVNNAPLGIATSDSNMQFKSANEAFCRIVGYSENELQKRSYRDITYPDDFEVSNKDMKELICGNIPYFSQEKKYVRKDGKIIDGKVTVSAIRNDKGEPVLYVAELEEITQRKQAEAELREAFNVLERVGEGIDSGLAVIGKDYRVVWANKLLMNLGVAPNKKCYQTFNHSETVCADCGAKKIFEQNVSSDVHEFKTMNSQGETIWIELRVTPLKDKDGNVTAALELAVPITERKKTEERLQIDDERLRKTEEIAHIGYWDWNIQSGALIWSEEHYRIFRLPLETVPKIDNFLAIIHPDDVGFVRHSIEDALKGKPYNIDFRIIHPDGTERVLNGTGEVIYDLERKPTRMFGTVQDITERKQTETAIVESEEKYRQLVESSTDGIFTIGLNAKVNWANSYGMKLLGYSESDLPVSLLKLIPAKYLLKAMKLFSDGLRGKVVTEPFDLEVYTKSRERIPVSYKGTLLHDEKGKVTGVLGIIRNFQEKKKMEKSLVESQDRFQDLIETTGEFIWEIDSQGRYTYCSPQMEKIWGLKPEDMLGKSPFDVMPPNDREKTLKFFGVMGGSPKPFSGLQTTAHNSQGNLIFVETNGVPFFDDKGNLLGFRGISRDITERKQMENNLLKSKAMLNEIEKTGKIGGWEVDVNTLTQTWTDETFHILEIDLSHGEPPVPKGVEFINPPYRSMAAESIQRAIEHGEPYDQEWEITTLKGNKRWVHAVAKANWENGKIKTISGSFQDITERKKIEEKLREISYNNELTNEKLRVVGSLTRHDVGNKLMTTKSNLYLLRKKIGDNPDLAKYIDNIDSSLDSSVEIFEFSRLYERIGVEKPSREDVFDCFNQAVALMQDLGDVEVVNEFKGLEVVADSLLKQLFYNLIDNSLKHGQKVTQIHLHYTEDGDGVKLFYEDNGVGVSEADKSKLFEVGFTTGKGSGLGLYLVKKMMDVYGWTITEEGEPGKGVKFTITIPELNKSGKENYQIA